MIELPLDPTQMSATAWWVFEAVALALSALVTLLHFVMEPLRWNACYLPRDAAAGLRADVRDALFCTAFATYVLPFKLGIPLRLYLLRRNGALSLHFLSVLIALDGILSLLAWLGVSGVCAWLAALHWQVPAYVWIGAGVGASVLAAVLLVLQRTRRQRWLRHVQEAAALLDRVAWRVARALAMLLADVLSYGLRHALIVLLIGVPVTLMPLAAAVGIVATFAGIVSGLPMGLLGYDATLVALLSLAHVAPEQALAVALINRGLNLGSAAILGVPAAMRLGLGSSLGAIVKRFREIGNGRI